MLRSEDFEVIHRGLFAADGNVRSSSRELLHGALSGRLRDAILALVDDMPERDKLDYMGAFYDTRDRGEARALADVIAQADDALCSVAAYRAAELGYTSLRPSVEALACSSSETLREVGEHALEIFERPKEDRVRDEGR